MANRAQRMPTSLRIATSLFVILWFVLATFPFFWTVWGSFKVELDFFSIADWTNALTGERTQAVYGSPFTTTGYEGAWIQEEFWRNVINTGLVCFFVVTISLTIGTLGGYALSRSSYNYTFWLLIAALIFRAMPPITLVAGYLLPFFEWNLWGILPTTVIVLVAINQPFTLWMLHSFLRTSQPSWTKARKLMVAISSRPFGVSSFPLCGRASSRQGYFHSSLPITTLPSVRCFCPKATALWCLRSMHSWAPRRPKEMLCLPSLPWSLPQRHFSFWSCSSNAKS